MSLLFFEKIPLVSSEAIGDFSEPQLIGHHYGDLRRTRVRCIKITPTVWLVGAHPWQEVTTCWVGDKRTPAFTPFIQQDSDGVTRQYIRLTLPPSSDAFTVEVAGFGKVSHRTGRLLENPADIIEDIALICGKTLRFPFFREASERRGLRLAGSVTEARTLRNYVNEVVESVGAVWAGDQVFYPGDPLSFATRIRNPTSLRFNIGVNDVAGKLSIYYAWNESRQWHGAHLEMTAVGAAYDTTGVYYARWLRQPKDVERLARELLGKRAGQFVKVSALVPKRIKAGECLSIDSPDFDGPFRALTSIARPASSEITGELIISLHEKLRVTKQTQELPLTRTERVDVALLDNDEVEISVFDQQNRPMVGVFVTVDGKTTKETDERGLTLFVLPAGNHTVVLSGVEIENNDPFPLFIP